MTADIVSCCTGRTFPSHPYFSIQLGPGQLSLFNLLKAYSLLDEEVGYCQGLSFIAGILLMHVSCQCSLLIDVVLILSEASVVEYCFKMHSLVLYVLKAFCLHPPYLSVR